MELTLLANSSRAVLMDDSSAGEPGAAGEVAMGAIMPPVAADLSAERAEDQIEPGREEPPVPSVPHAPPARPTRRGRGPGRVAAPACGGQGASGGRGEGHPRRREGARDAAVRDCTER